MKIIECPRDAMQGQKDFIPTDIKINYLNKLLKVGFDTIDFGSFVSPKAIPQLQDTKAVLEGLDLENAKSKLLAIVANERGAKEAVEFPQINFLGFPFSVSETFQQRNTNSSIEESLKRVEEIQTLCVQHNKQLVVYLSMAFGNPYGDQWDPEIVTSWAGKLHFDLGIEILALSDTIGSSNAENIHSLFTTLSQALPLAEIGAHLHTTPQSWREKMAAAYAAGCKRFDGALGGWGGCPMAADTLTGNMPTENILHFLKEHQVELHLDDKALHDARAMLHVVFNTYVND